jgi:protein O-mannosyl-transferase
VDNTPKIKVFLYALLPTVLLCSAYCNTFSSPLVLDDFHSFVLDPSVHLKELSVSSLTALSRTGFGVQRWLPMLSFSLDLWFGKGEIFFFHLTNLIIHILCSFAVLMLIFNLLQSRKETGHELSVPSVYFAIWVAGLWALNPVQTNAVTYLVQRMASLQGLFFITSVAFYVLGRRNHLHHRNRAKASLSYLGCLWASLAAFLCKENSAMLPVVLLVTEVWFFTPDLHRSFWKWLKSAPWFIWGFFVIGMLAVAPFGIRAVQDLTAGYSIRHFTLVERLLTESRIVVWYLSLLLWPAPSRLSLEHDVVVSSSLLDPPSTLLASVFLAFLGWMILRYRKRFPLITYGGAWFLLNLVIESTIVPLELIFEHRLYLPSAGFALVVVCLLVSGLTRFFANRASRDLVIVSSCVFALLFSGLTLLTFYRNEAWKDSLTIYQDTAQKAPKHPRCHANLAVAYGRAELYEEAIREAEMAIELGQEHHEQYFVAANTILVSLTGLGRFEEVVKKGEDLFESRPKNFDAGSLTNFHLNLAQAHLKLGNLPQAYAVAMLAFQSVRLTGNSLYQKRLVEGMLVAILRDAVEKQIDLDGDGSNDPGDSSIPTWIAKEFLRKGEREEAAYLLMLATEANSEDGEAASLLDEIKREDALN